MRLIEWRSIACAIIAATMLCCHSAQAQVVLNEANAVGPDSFIQTDLSKPYEGFDYGVIPHSGNNNPPNDPDPTAGNPFVNDVDAGTGGDQTTLPNGWDRLAATPLGFARIKQNGGDWFELAITEDHTDLRGYTFFWENDDGPVNGVSGENPAERGFVKLTNDKAFADLRAGTIITFSEDDQFLEIRDEYPLAAPEDEFGNPAHNTGFVYDLSTDTSFSPFDGDSDWHIHFHVDESFTDNGIATQFFEAFSDIKVDNDNWQMRIYDATNTAIVAEAESPGAISDLTTGLVQGLVGELAPGWGANTGATGVNNQELAALIADPVTGITAADYEDVDFSTFGTPNLFNVLTEDTLDGVQDFDTNLRDNVRDNTYDWTAAGTADFGVGGNYERADDNSAAPAGGPDTTWTAVLNNTAGGSKVAQVTTNETADFVAVMADSGTMTLEVQSGNTLTVDGDDQPGRVLVMDGGILAGEGTVSASEVEAFDGATIAPGSSAGTLSVTGGVIAGSGSSIEIELDGDVDGQDLLSASGDVNIAAGSSLDMEFLGEPSSGDLIKAGTYTIVESTGGAVQGTFSSVTDLGIYDDDVGVTYNASSVTITLDHDLNPGDATLDGLTNFDDFLSLQGSFGGSGGWTTGDFTGDGNVNFDDFLQLQGAFGSMVSAPAASGAFAAVPTPEPSSLLLVALGLLGLSAVALRRRTK